MVVIKSQGTSVIFPIVLVLQVCAAIPGLLHKHVQPFLDFYMGVNSNLGSHVYAVS